MMLMEDYKEFVPKELVSAFLFDWIESHGYKHSTAAREMMAEIEKLPSVQQLIVNDWINDDCISRKMAVEAIEEIVSSMSVCFSVDECHGMKRMQKLAIEEVINLPAIQTTNHISDVNKGDSNDVAIY